MQITEVVRVIEFVEPPSKLAKGGDEATRGIKELDSMIVKISHRNVSIGSTAHSLWIIELSLLIASIITCSSNGIEWNW